MHVWASPASSAVPPAARSSTSPAPATRFSALSRSLPPQAHPSRTPPCSRTPPPASSSNSAPPASPRRNSSTPSTISAGDFFWKRLAKENDYGGKLKDLSLGRIQTSTTRVLRLFSASLASGIGE